MHQPYPDIHYAVIVEAWTPDDEHFAVTALERPNVGGRPYLRHYLYIRKGRAVEFGDGIRINFTRKEFFLLPWDRCSPGCVLNLDPLPKTVADKIIKDIAEDDPPQEGKD